MEQIKIIFKHLSLLLLVFCLLYGGIIALTYICYPSDMREATIDAGENRKTAYNSIIKKMAASGLMLHADRRPKILLIGSSNVREGFRPVVINRYFDGYAVHNLAQGSSNVTQIRDIFELADHLIAPNWGPGDIIVWGVFYGSFVDNKNLWHGERSSVSDEKIRYGFYHEKNGVLIPNFGKEGLFTLAVFLRPIFCVETMVFSLQKVYENVRDRLKNRLCSKDVPSAGNASRGGEYPLIDDVYRKKAFEFWEGYMNLDQGFFNKEQFTAFSDEVRSILAKGVRLVVVDMPLPSWHRNGVPMHEEYQKTFLPYFQDLAGDHFYYLDLSQSMSDDDFYDSAHPFPESANHWSSVLSNNIKKRSSMN